jgi:predicted RNA methylase
MMASLVLSPKSGQKVLDICAAPGGKTTHIAQLMNNTGEVVACDIHEHKIKIIEENAKRMGFDIIKSKLMDATKLKDEFLGQFDKVLADVPCSGYGIIRRKPDIKWKNENTDDICAVAKEILTNASKYVRIGGELKFGTIALRAGYCVMDNPYDKDINDAGAQSITAGIGYKNKNFFMDFAYAYTTGKSKFTEYDYNVINLDHVNHLAQLSFGVRF